MKKILLSILVFCMPLVAFSEINPQASEKTKTGQYTIQLFAARQESTLHQYIKENDLQDETTIVQKNINNQDWYALVYGRYNTKAEAQSELKEIKNDFPGISPEVRYQISTQKEAITKEASGTESIGGLSQKVTPSATASTTPAQTREASAARTQTQLPRLAQATPAPSNPVRSEASQNTNQGRATQNRNKAQKPPSVEIHKDGTIEILNNESASTAPGVLSEPVNLHYFDHDDPDKLQA